MQTCAFVSVLLVALSLVSSVPIPEDENRLISFTPTPPTTSITTLEGLHKHHENISSVCGSMIPVHNGTVPQSTVAPYTVTVTETSIVSPSKIYQIVYSSVGEHKIRGVYMQARNTAGKPVGFFVPSDDPHFSYPECVEEKGEQVKNSGLYLSYQPTDEVLFSWVPPSEPTTVTFIATIVESYSVFWVNVKSPPMTVQNTPQ